MSKIALQRILLVIGVLALIVVLVEITLSIAATTHGSNPAKIVHTNAGPYPLTVNLYKYPANAGYALPFSIVPQTANWNQTTFDVTSIPNGTIPATKIHASTSTDTSLHGVQGTAEITVQGPWLLHIVVAGNKGPASVDLPIDATAPPPIPLWLGWLIGGLVPLGGLLAFLTLQKGGQVRQKELQHA